MAVPIPTLGRRGLAAGATTARAAGNSVVTSDVRGETAARPMAGNARNAPPLERAVRTTPSGLNRRVYAAVTQHNRLVARDRHIVDRRGRTVTSAARQEPYGGTPNPEADGPAQPAHEQVNRTLSWQVGTDITTNLDNDLPHASTSAGGRKFPLGNQGSTPSERVNGGTPHLYRPYGARGFVIGPDPKVFSLPGGPGKANQLVAQGSSDDGPQRVSGGAPHGLHSPTVSDRMVTLKRLRATKTSQRPPAFGRMQRPANSKVAGQSYSQTIVPQSGRGGGALPRSRPVRTAGLNDRFMGR